MSYNETNKHDAIAIVGGAFAAAACIVGVVWGIVAGVNHSNDTKTKQMTACVENGGDWTITANSNGAACTGTVTKQ